MPSPEEIWISLLAFAMTAVAAGVLVGPLFFFFRRRRLLPMQRIRFGRWSGLEVWLSFLVFFLIPVLTRDFLERLGLFSVMFPNPPTPMRGDIWTAPLYTLLTLAFLFVLLFAGSRTRPSDIGLTSGRWPQNTILGYVGFLALTPVILGLYFLTLLVLHALFQGPVQPHPLEELGKEPLEPIEWVLVFLRAGVSAALLEEVFFRGVLQGWLRRASLVGHGMVIAIALALGFLAYVNTLTVPGEPPREADVVEVPREPNPGPLLFAVVMVLGYAGALLKLRERNHAALAILGSAMLFAAFHSMVWPSPIPLLLLGIGLGFLAHRTQSLVPSIVLHGLFNTVACLELLLEQGL